MLYYPNKQNPIDYKNKRNKTNWKKATSTNRRRDKWKYCCIRITSTKYKSRIKWKANRTLGYPLETVAWVTPWQSLLDYRIEARLKLNTALWKNLVVDNIDKQSFEGYVVCFLNSFLWSFTGQLFIKWNFFILSYLMRMISSSPSAVLCSLLLDKGLSQDTTPYVSSFTFINFPKGAENSTYSSVELNCSLWTQLSVSM